MTLSELLLQTFDIEMPMTRRILERVPLDKPGWAPHPRSMPLGRLAMHVATLPGLATVCLTTQHFDLANLPGPDQNLPPGQSLLSVFDKSEQAMRAALARAKDDDLSEPWPFVVSGRVLSDKPRAVTLLHNFLGHLSHHRAQLGMYLRLLDLPVPGVYGPSADETPGPR
jgi:uncharacterized damage-inducible protein DinB